MLKKHVCWILAQLMTIVSAHASFAADTKADKPKINRPPQFVMFAFDGSYKNEVWQYIRDYSKSKKENGEDVRFTFFISPVYLLFSENKTYYNPPGYRLGRDAKGNIIKIKNKGSAIGWGESPEDISTRIDQMNDAFLEGHEMGSHAVGHFDAGFKECEMSQETGKCAKQENGDTIWKWDLRWTSLDWKNEFTQFNSILENVFSLNKIQPSEKYPRGFVFNKNDIVGFRAPVLGVSDGLWPTLQEFGFKYDTSKVNTTYYWPTKSEFGIWDFPLAEIPEPGTAKKWISMDYNHCVRQSAMLLQEDPTLLNIRIQDPITGVSKKVNAADCLTEIKPEQKVKVKKQIMDLYTSYFNSNYYGNRAPIHIGHHFSKWMSGAYFEAFFDFAQSVCSKPEVKCGTYKELMSFLEEKSASELLAFKRGQFTKLPQPKSARPARVYDLDVSLISQAENLKAVVSGEDKKIPGLNIQIAVGNRVFNNSTLPISVVRGLTDTGNDIKIRVRVLNHFGKEIQTATQVLQNVGTSSEALRSENIEERWTQGHLPEADKLERNELIDDKILEQETFGH